jgi:hypothetical protein
MPRQDLPPRRKRRPAVAGVAAPTIIGIASARDNLAAPTQCLSEAPTALDARTPPPSETSAPTETALSAKSAQASAEPPAEQPPAEQPPAAQPPAQQPPADPGATDKQSPALDVLPDSLMKRARQAVLIR